MVSCHQKKIIILTIFLFFVVWRGFSVESEARPEALERATFESSEPQKLKLVVGKSEVIDSPISIKRASLGNPEVADVLLISPKQIHLTGKAPGLTSLILWGVKPTHCAFFDLEVSVDLSLLKEKLHELLPHENIKVNAVHDSIVLSGEVSSTSNMSTALSLAEQYVGEKDKLVNLMQIGGTQQVMLEVRVAEMSRYLMRRLGFNFAYIRGADFALGLIGDLTLVEEIPAQGPFDIFLSEQINALFRTHHKTATWVGFIDALKENGLVKVLAEPTLITTSGQEAHFLAGGEIPIPIPEELGRVEIEYKPYGVGLIFKPTVLSSNKISMRVAPEVSEPDYTQVVVFAGWQIPAFTTRRTSTVIELADGQSFAIAGLIKEDTRHEISKFPILGDIPILGALFRSSRFQTNETELVIIVTPHLVKPLDMAKQTLPTDQYVEPDDLEFYLWGAFEGGKESIKTPETLAPQQGGLEGEFGHIVP